MIHNFSRDLLFTFTLSLFPWLASLLQVLPMFMKTACLSFSSEHGDSLQGAPMLVETRLQSRWVEIAISVARAGDVLLTSLGRPAYGLGNS